MYNISTKKSGLFSKFTKLKKRLEKNIQNGRVFKLSRYKRKQLIARYQRYARQLKLAGMSAGLIGFLMAANPSAVKAQYEVCDPNPFAGISGEYYIDPAFKDIDGDGDVDMVYGTEYGEIRYYESNGDGTFTQQTGANNPFDAIVAEYANGGDDYVGYYATPTFADLDGDGDCDLVFGAYYTTGYETGFFYYENNGGVFTEQTGANNPFDGLDTGYYGAPTFADIDGDGDLDLISGNDDGDILFFENMGGTFTPQTGANNPFDFIGSSNPYEHSKPAFSDVDGDGDLDLVVGFGDDGTSGNSGTGILHYYENTGGVFTEQTGANNPFDSFTFETGDTFYPWITPVFVDLDGDGIDELYVSHHASGTLPNGDPAGPGRGQIITIATTCPSFIPECEATNGALNATISDD